MIFSKFPCSDFVRRGRDDDWTRLGCWSQSNNSHLVRHVWKASVITFMVKSNRAEFGMTEISPSTIISRVTFITRSDFFRFTFTCTSFSYLSAVQFEPENFPDEKRENDKWVRFFLSFEVRIRSASLQNLCKRHDTVIWRIGATSHLYGPTIISIFQIVFMLLGWVWTKVRRAVHFWISVNFRCVAAGSWQSRRHLDDLARVLAQLDSLPSSDQSQKTEVTNVAFIQEQTPPVLDSTGISTKF